MKDWDGVKGIIYNWYPGQIGQVALAEILAGQTNPSGKLPMSIERDFKDSPAYGYISDSTHFMCDDKDFMNMNPEYNRWQYDMSIEDAPDNLYDVHYDEGIFVGYRWYEKERYRGHVPVWLWAVLHFIRNFKLRNHREPPSSAAILFH